MRARKKPLPIQSTIGAQMRVEGGCAFQGGLRVDGHVRGDIVADREGPSLLVIGHTGQVQGAIEADHVIISGTVIGPVSAWEVLELHAPARVEGNVRYHTLEMQHGATVSGQLQPQITPPAASAQDGTPPAQPPGSEPTEPTLDADPS